MTESNYLNVCCLTLFLHAHAATAQLNSTGVISVREGGDTSLCLEAVDNSPFSPVVTFQWMHNGAQLGSSQRISLTNYCISITGVQREDAGNYQLVVFNSAGFGMGNFTLDVLCKLVCYQHCAIRPVFPCFITYMWLSCDQVNVVCLCTLLVRLILLTIFFYIQLEQ